jgi:LPXTG-motif cell wall-anchored protein
MEERFNKWKFYIFIILFVSLINPVSSQTAVEWVEKGIAYGKQGEYNKAIEAYNKAIAIDPNDKKALLNKGFAFAELGEHNKAIEAYKKAIAIDPNDKDALLIGGLVFFELGEYNKAIEAYNKAIAIDPNDAAAWAYKGTAFTVLGKYDEAIEAYNKAIALDPNYSEAWVNKGTAFAALGEYIIAIEAYDEAIAIDPNYKDAWYNKGFAFDELGEHNKAIEAYNKALVINPNDKGAWLNKGVAFDELGEYDNAIEAYNKALAIDPNYEKAKLNRDLVIEKKAGQMTPTQSEGQENNWIVISGIAILIIIGIIVLRNRKNKNNNDTLINPNNINYKINKCKMFCQKCGAELKEDSNFCSSCGSSLQNATVREEKTGLIKHFWDLVKLSFKWSGRFSRKEFITLWLGGVLISFLIIVVVILIGFDIWLESVGLDEIVIIMSFLIFAIMNYSAAIRRFHDMDKSGWYVLLMFIPLVWFFVFVYLLFEKGKDAGGTRWG